MGYSLAGAAAAAIANETTKRAKPSHSPFDNLGRRMHLTDMFGRGSHRKSLAGALISSPLIHNLFGGRKAKHNWLRGALVGLGAGLGSMALPRQKKSVWGKRAGHKGSNLMTIGRILAGGLALAATSSLLNNARRRRHIHEQHTHDQFE